VNVEIGAEAALFPEKEYIKGIFVAVHLVEFFVESTSVAHVGPVVVTAPKRRLFGVAIGAALVRVDPKIFLNQIMRSNYLLPWIKYGVRSPKFIWAPYHVM
jgi:hypothetical protein